jgi:peptidoglycan hydrolase-like protein with peptidoglycan-binding domain
MLGVNDLGADVCLWQKFLIAQRFSLAHGANGVFGGETERGTRAFQAREHLAQTGELDGPTQQRAEALGFVPQDRGARPVPTDFLTLSTTFPPPPTDLASPDVPAQEARFGKIEFRPANDPNNPDGIIITNGFEQNIVQVTVPQLANMTDAPRNLTIRCHRLVASQLLALWSAWEKARLLSRVKTFGGAFEPRFVRGQPGTLSNHAFGAAFDINFPWNPLKEVPALVGKRGCVRELVPIANRLGFFWGGHFRSRFDGNHFEVAQVLSQPQVATVLRSLDFA